MALSFRTALAGLIMIGSSAHVCAAPIALSSTSVELPGGDRPFPAGPNVETVSANCLSCHSAGMVLNQPALKKAVWDAEVRKMITVFKAPIAEADVPAIVDYLAATKGAN